MTFKVRHLKTECINLEMRHVCSSVCVSVDTFFVFFFRSPLFKNYKADFDETSHTKVNLDFKTIQL